MAICDLRRMWTAVSLVSLLVAAPAHAISKPSVIGHSPVAVMPFKLDAGRILVEATFGTPDGGKRRALAWFNMGMQAPIVSKSLYRELGVDHGAPLRLRIGDLTLEAASDAVVDGDGGLGAPSFAQSFGHLPVEAMLPASLFLAHRLTLDYKARLLTVEGADGKPPTGFAVPIDVNEATGLASIKARIDGQDYAFVIDAGSGYSWMRGSILAHWLADHPEWRRAEGAMGAANYNMLDLDFEKRGTIARVPNLSIGALELKNVAFFGSGPILGGYIDGMVGDFFWDNWQKSAPGPVVGWLGPNVLKEFALTIDYPNHASYWRSNGVPDAHDLDSVGVTLVRRGERYFVGGLVKTSAQPPADGAAVGDELLAVDDIPVRDATKDVVLSALHGRAGQIRRLTLARDGATLQVELPALDLH